jgi:hypothetical protein
MRKSGIQRRSAIFPVIFQGMVKKFCEAEFPTELRASRSFSMAAISS